MVRLSGLRGIARGAALLAAALAGACARPGATTDGGADRGSTLYATYCVACHLTGGTAVPNLRPALGGSELVNGDPAPLAAWVMYGERPPGWADRHYPPVMPHYVRLRDEDLALLLTYLRTHFGNQSPPVDAAAIAAVRSTRR